LRELREPLDEGAALVCVSCAKICAGWWSRFNALEIILGEIEVNR
jgi:hypothetical protein